MNTETKETDEFRTTDDVVRALAQWSFKYPRPRIMSVDQRKECNRLLKKIERAAQSFYPEENI